MTPRGGARGVVLLGVGAGRSAANEDDPSRHSNHSPHDPRTAATAGWFRPDPCVVVAPPGQKRLRGSANPLRGRVGPQDGLRGRSAGRSGGAGRGARATARQHDEQQDVHQDDDDHGKNLVPGRPVPRGRPDSSIALSHVASLQRDGLATTGREGVPNGCGTSGLCIRRQANHRRTGTPPRPHR
jgi:hypothetical protein